MAYQRVEYTTEQLNAVMTVELTLNEVLVLRTMAAHRGREKRRALPRMIQKGSNEHLLRKTTIRIREMFTIVDKLDAILPQGENHDASV